MGTRGIGKRNVRERDTLCIVLGLAVASTAIGCGREDDPTARVPSMLAMPAAVGGSEAASGGAPPSGPRSIELVPKRPLAGKRLSATARFASGVGPRPEVAYQWRTGSGRLLGEGQELDTSGLEPGTMLEVVATPTVEDGTGEARVHRFRLLDPEKQIALVVIDAREGKAVG
ncbi:hypothetical protein K2X89_14935, partial [Myxococcota bacterium]|nr:hypothetical protein [Myxococcota bacterium]